MDEYEAKLKQEEERLKVDTRERVWGYEQFKDAYQNITGLNPIPTPLNPPLMPEWVKDAYLLRDGLRPEKVTGTMTIDSFTTEYTTGDPNWDEPTYTITDTELRLAIDNYLLNVGTTLWSDFEIQRNDRRKIATQWLYEQVRGVLYQAGVAGEYEGDDDE